MGVPQRGNKYLLGGNNEQPVYFGMILEAKPPADYCLGRLVLESGLTKEPQAPYKHVKHGEWGCPKEVLVPPGRQ